MGAITSFRKRQEDFSSTTKSSSSQFEYNHAPKRPRLLLMPETPEGRKSSISRLSLYPEAKVKIEREIHAPVRVSKPGFLAAARRSSSSMGNGIGSLVNNVYNWATREKKESLRHVAKGVKKEVIVIDGESVRDEVLVDGEGVRNDVSSFEEMEVDVGRDDSLREEKGILAKYIELDAKASSSVGVSGLINGELLLLSPESGLGVPVHKKLQESVGKRDARLRELQFQIEYNEKKRAGLSALRPAKKVEDEVIEPFIDLTEEDEEQVARALSNFNMKKVLVTHENSNIQITGELLQCLKPKAWLNDEVINVYLELLKERETREPNKYLKCHFFNTFFYKKLIGGRNGYDYNSVRRWTTKRKLGYCLFECDKIFVPVHKEVHWCLAVINKKDEKFQYLDSLGGTDKQVMKVLAKYLVDEVKDKSGKDIDVTSWKQEYVEEMPNQENGYDCGMFMIKYADFYSRGIGLCFNQEHMPYFRKRTAKEILRLRAE